MKAHQQHKKPSQQLQPALKGWREGQHAAQRAHQRAHRRIGHHPAHIIQQGRAQGGPPAGPGARRIPGETLGEIQPPAHGRAVHRGGQPDEKEHAIPHARLRQLARGQQIQQSEMLQQQIKGDRRHQQARRPPAAAPLPAVEGSVIAQPFDEGLDVLRGDQVGVIGQLCDGIPQADPGLTDARGAAQLFFDFGLAAGAGHALNVQPDGF
ncbi:hypothetical protein SDC9_97569 [bioreactor metagenome]|uniref:Uncharacterized protein n=1 Tax=bioreactor metagenome TaxID=1076179 RepID=A0A645ACA2_9ZZZZ